MNKAIETLTAIFFLCFTEVLCSRFGCPADTEPIGCYKDGEITGRNRRPFVEVLFDNIERNIVESLKEVTCKCATEASKKKYPFYAVKNNGICLSGPPYAVEFDILGTSTTCQDSQRKACDPLDDICSGTEDSIYVHRVVYEPCNVTFVRLGCYKDRIRPLPRPLPDYIMNSRDRKHRGFEDPAIDWNDWNNWMPEFICRCAQKAQSMGNSVFGVQFFGECWSGSEAIETYSRDGETESCISYDYKSCKPDDELCVGKQATNFVYSIAEPCNVEYKEIGCYKDNYWNPPRPIPEMIATELDPLHSLGNGHRVLWYKWNQYFPQMICRCAKETFSKKWDTFGVQSYGECYSGPNAVSTYTQDGTSKQCVKQDFAPCPDGTLNCVGPQANNYVYSVLSCDLEFEVLGCYKDDQKKPRPLPKYILNDRDPRAKKSFSGRRIDWRNWDNYVPQFVCRCARKAKQLGYKTFGTQFYGECWSGPEDEVNGLKGFNRTGTSDRCIGAGFQKCANGDLHCIGQAKHNYVYRLRD